MTLTADSMITLILVVSVLLFWGLELLVRGLFRLIQDAGAVQPTFTFGELEKYCRVASADLVLKFVSLLVKTAAGLAVSVSFYKTFADVAVLMLPDRTLGVTVLMSYCGLITAIGVVRDDIMKALKQLFR